MQTINCAHVDTYNLKQVVTESGYNTDAVLTFDVVISDDCRCNTVTMPQSVADFTHTITFASNPITLTTEFAETKAGCMDYIISVTGNDPGITVDETTAPPIVTTSFDVQLPGDAALHGTTATVSITAYDNLSGSSKYNTFVITWEDVCWTTIITPEDLADVLLSTTKLGA